MKKYWENLRPFEKRVVVAFGALFFVVLNFVFVFPHFSDLSDVKFRMGEAQRKLAKYQSEIALTNVYVAGLREFEKEGGDVPAEEQTFQFANAIQAQMAESGVHFKGNSRINTQTNQFFIEKTQSVQVQAKEQELVNFLYQLGAGNSQIRVRGLSIRPELPARQQLDANVTLVASYQKKPSTRTAVPATPGAGRSSSASPSRSAAPPSAQSPNLTTKRP